VRVYLDNCCFNRPFDDHRQTRVRLEAEAKLSVQDRIRAGDIELAWSFILDFENIANPFEERRTTIQAWKEMAVADVEETEPVLATARTLVALGVKAKDALHVSCAIESRCDYFVTTDDRLLGKSEGISAIAMIDPTALVRELNL